MIKVLVKSTGFITYVTEDYFEKYGNEGLEVVLEDIPKVVQEDIPKPVKKLTRKKSGV